MSEKRKRGVVSREAVKSRRGAVGRIKEEGRKEESEEEVWRSSQEREKENVKNESSPLSDVEERESVSESDEEMESGRVADALDVDMMEYDDDTIFEAGMILEVYMENFMNHRKFSLKLGKLVNFITGQNGSGKSACVAAIQLCLGATASKTGRASNMAKMVRHGSSGPAICRVKLLNEGDDAYKPEVYGSEITVERKITKQGLASYSIFGELNNGHISHDKHELERILQNFNIYVDNPCCILTQEQSKTFINGQEREKYIFFLKATGLERISEELIEAIQMVATGEEALLASKATKDRKQETLRELQNIYGQLSALDKYKDDIQACIAKMFWCDVAEAQKVVEEIEGQKASHDKKLNEAEAVFFSQQEKLNNFGDVEQTAAIIEDLVQKRAELETDYATVVASYKAKTSVANECSAVVQQLKNTLSNYHGRLSTTQQEISDLQAASMKDAEEAEKLVLEKISTCRDALEQSVNSYVSANKLSQEVSQKLDTARSSRSQVIRQRDQVERILIDSKHQLNEMKKSGCGGRLNRFHNKMSQVVDDIKGTSFNSNISGPLGMDILLKDDFKHLGSAVERCLFRSLSSFVVDNVPDRTKLYGILRKYGLHMWSQIYMQSKRPRYQVQTNKEVPGTVFVLDAIQVANDMVFNALVDQNKIDQVVITQTEIESDQKYVTIVNGHRQFLPGISNVLTMDGRSISYKGGNKSSEQNSFSYQKLLAADTSEIIANLGINIARDEDEVAALREDINQHSENVSLLEGEKAQNEKNLLRLSREEQHYRKQLSDLQNEHSDIQTSNSAGEADFASLESEALELTDAISEMERRIEIAVEEMTSVKEESSNCLAEKRRVESKRKSLISQQNEQEEIIQNHVNAVENLRRNVAKAERDVLKFKKVVEDINKLIDDKLQVVEVTTEKARIHTPEHVPDWDGNPLELGRKDSRESLNKRINHLKGQIEEGKRNAGLEGYTLEILSSRLDKASNDYHKFRNEHKEIKKRIKNMDQDLKERQTLWEKQVMHYSKMVSKSFDSYMQKRGFSGSVIFDHDNKLLTVKSQTDNANVTTRCTDLRQMSGGERSYTALCLLLALGHVIECPFRLMDEYDVFLDQMARKLTLDILAEYAKDKEQKGRQFIIITPQDLRHMKTSNEVRIHKMPDPVRIHTGVAQQQTLDF